MAYIGASPTTSAFVTDTFNGNGSTVAFTMSVAPANTTSIIVAVSGVLQDPSTYSVSGTTLTFSAAPPSGTGNISVRFLGIPASGVTSTAYRTQTEFTATAGQTTFSVPSYTVGYIDVYRNGVLLGSADFTATSGTTVVLTNPASSGDLVETVSFYVSSVLNAIPAVANAVTTSYINDGAVTTAKIADANVTQAKLAAGVAGNGPAFSAYMSANQIPTNNTSTKLALDTLDATFPNVGFNTSTYRFTPTVAGYYQINGAVAGYSSNTSLVAAYTYLQKNGTTIFASGTIINIASSLLLQPSASGIVYLNGSTDYVELYGQVNAGSSSQIFAGSSQQYTVMSGCLIRAA